MYPVFLHLGPITVHWYGVFMACGFIAAFAHWSLLGRNRGWSYAEISDMLFWIIVSGVVGARIAYVCSEIGYFLDNPLQIVRIDKGGLIYYGGFVGSAAALLLFAKLRRKRIWNLLDFTISALPLSHAFGRIGCFMNGCCYGRVCDGILSVHFPRASLAVSEQIDAGLLPVYAERSLGVHPVQLYEMAFNFCLYVALLQIYRTRRIEGTLVVAYLWIYAFGRFLLEFMRGHTRIFMFGLSMAQWTSVSLFLIGCVLALWLRSNGRPVDKNIS